MSGSGSGEVLINKYMIIYYLYYVIFSGCFFAGCFLGF